MASCYVCCCIVFVACIFFVFFFNDTATTEIYTLSLHDALPITGAPHCIASSGVSPKPSYSDGDRKSTRLNSSHANISYAVFCLKKKKKQQLHPRAKKKINRQDKQYNIYQDK